MHHIEKSRIGRCISADTINNSNTKDHWQHFFDLLPYAKHCVLHSLLHLIFTVFQMSGYVTLPI